MYLKRERKKLTHGFYYSVIKYMVAEKENINKKTGNNQSISQCM